MHKESAVESIVTHDVSMKSLVAALAEMGFELEPDHRLSFHHPEKQLYVYVGKVCDVSTKEKFRVPKEAFKEQNNVSQLTLMVRESGTGLSASK